MTANTTNRHDNSICPCFLFLFGSRTASVPLYEVQVRRPSNTILNSSHQQVGAVSERPD